MTNPGATGTTGAEARLPYAAPALRTFGTLADLTETIGVTAKTDGGMMANMSRSSP